MPVSLGVVDVPVLLGVVDVPVSLGVVDVPVSDGVVDVLLAVADPTSVQALYSNYGRLHISGWLRPVVRS